MSTLLKAIQYNIDYPDPALLTVLAGALLLLAFIVALAVYVFLKNRNLRNRPAGVEPSSKPWPRTGDTPIYSERRLDRRPPLE